MTRGTAARYGTEEFRQIAERATILRCEVGSGAHGIAIPGTDDRDEMGLCIEPPSHVIGLREFEQYIRRTAWARGGEHEPSQAGDLDLVVYSLRKWMRLALNGNPSILLLLFAPDSACQVLEPAAVRLRENAGKIISQQSGFRFLGYLHSQREKLLGIRSPEVHRLDLVQKYGYDTKFAAHAVRLGMQGIQLMQTGRLQLPMSEWDAEFVRTIKTGRYRRVEDVLDEISRLARELEEAIQVSELQAAPDREWADEYLVSVYRELWG